MKKIAIYCVNYNSYQELSAFLKSIEQSYGKVKDIMVVDVFVADNTECDIQEIRFNSCTFNLKVYKFYKNLGYFGAVQKMMELSKPDDYDFTIISNVDLTLGINALEELYKTQIDDTIGWIAPCIFSKRLNKDRNPAKLKRYSKRKLLLLLFMFKHAFLMKLYRRFLYGRKKEMQISSIPHKIYAGHGSFIILTKSYIQNCKKINYPVFLFCEELYLAENCLRKNLNVTYNPKIIIYDDEHVSTEGLSKKAIFYKYNYQAIKYIIKQFY